MKKSKTDYDLTKCPYNNNHRFTKQKYFYHISRCKDGLKMKSFFRVCQFNPLHIFLEYQIMAHQAVCIDRQRSMSKTENLMLAYQMVQNLQNNHQQLQEQIKNKQPQQQPQQKQKMSEIQIELCVQCKQMLLEIEDQLQKIPSEIRDRLLKLLVQNMQLDEKIQKLKPAYKQQVI